jgi:hypothetical protein
MAITSEKFTIGIINNNGYPRTGALVELKINASTYVLPELGNGKYQISLIPTGKYFVWIDSVNSRQSVAVGSGQVSALGNEANAFLVGTADNWTLEDASSVKTTLSLENVTNIALPDPTGQDGKYLGVSSDAYILEDIATPIVAASDVEALRVTGSTYGTLQDAQNLYHSAGSTSGGLISDVGGANISIASGTGFIRPTDDATSTLFFFDWPAIASLAIPLNSTQYVGVKYDGGSPIAYISAVENFDDHDNFELGLVHNVNGELHITNDQHYVGDSVGLIIKRSQETMPFKRDEKNGGLTIDEVGTRNITMSAGAIWDGLTRWPLGPIDTSASDTFISWYVNGADPSGWTQVGGQTQWNNTQYDDGSGTLQTLSTNKWGAQYFFIGVDNDMYMVYGTAEYNSSSLAEASTAPSNLPPNFGGHAVLIGRVVFKEGEATGNIESAFTTTFAGSAVTTHGDLSGLTDNDHPQYALLSGVNNFDKNISVGASSVASIGAITPDPTQYGQYSITDLAEALTITAPTLGLNDGRKLIIRIKDDGTARALTFTNFTAIGVTLPTTTTISKLMYIGCIYNTDQARWDIIAVTEEA